MAILNWMRIVRGGECLNVEFKRQAPKLERLSKTFSAFANSSGGYVFLALAIWAISAVSITFREP